MFKSNIKHINPGLGSGSPLFQALMDGAHRASSECIYSTTMLVMLKATSTTIIIIVFHGSGDTGNKSEATKPRFRAAVSLCSGGSLGSGAMEAVEEEWMKSASRAQQTPGAPACIIHVATFTYICLPTEFQ